VQQKIAKMEAPIDIAGDPKNVKDMVERGKKLGKTNCSSKKTSKS
jgi:hypothetical protein